MLAGQMFSDQKHGNVQECQHSISQKVLLRVELTTVWRAESFRQKNLELYNWTYGLLVKKLSCVLSQTNVCRALGSQQKDMELCNRTNSPFVK